MKTLTPITKCYLIVSVETLIEIELMLAEPAAVAVYISFLFEPFVFSLVLPGGALVFFIAMLFCLKLPKDVETSPFAKVSLG